MSDTSNLRELDTPAHTELQKFATVLRVSSPTALTPCAPSFMPMKARKR